MIIDVDRLRHDLTDYYGAAMTSGFPRAMMELDRVESASEEELVDIAVECGMDLADYEVI